jgi:hypothetical protein
MMLTHLQGRTSSHTGTSIEVPEDELREEAQYRHIFWRLKLQVMSAVSDMK